MLSPVPENLTSSWHILENLVVIKGQTVSQTICTIVQSSSESIIHLVNHHLLSRRTGVLLFAQVLRETCRATFAPSSESVTGSPYFSHTDVSHNLRWNLKSVSTFKDAEWLLKLFFIDFCELFVAIFVPSAMWSLTLSVQKRELQQLPYFLYTMGFNTWSFWQRNCHWSFGTQWYFFYILFLYRVICFFTGLMNYWQRAVPGLVRPRIVRVPWFLRCSSSARNPFSFCRTISMISSFAR